MCCIMQNKTSFDIETLKIYGLHGPRFYQYGLSEEEVVKYLKQQARIFNVFLSFSIIHKKGFYHRQQELDSKYDNKYKLFEFGYCVM